MSYKTILAEIQASQLTTFCPLATFRHKSHIDILPRNHRGLYWFWCNSSFENLATIQTRIGTGEVPISKLISDREGLNNICKIKIQDFTIIYNGIGGYEREPATFGLRERVLQELNATNIRTGTLNLLNRLNIHSTIDNWGISFFDFDNIANTELLNQLPVNVNRYLDHANAIEMNWRIEYGTPILTRY